MAIRFKRVVAVAVLVLLAIAVARAATRKYLEREDAFRKECEAQRQKLGLSAGDLRAKYPTPEIRLVSAACIAPGATADVVVSGRIATDAKFFVENDSFEVVKESITANQYRATLKAAPVIGPEYADLAMIQPVTGRKAVAVDAVKVGARYEWTMNAANGWKVVARSQAATNPCAADETAIRYDVSFFRAGETTPCEKATARLVFLPVNTRNYRFDLSAAPAASTGPMEAYQAMMQKLTDPKLSATERQQLMAKLQELSKEMTAMMTKQADPVYAKQQAEAQQRREQEFGCRAIELTAESGKLTGEMNCSQKVGRQLAITGTMAPMK